MIKNLFKPSWKNNSVDKRLQFIAEVDVLVTANQTILEKLADNDVDSSVRQAAMAKISDPQALYNLWQSYSINDAQEEKADSDKAESRQLAETAFRNVIQSGSELSEADIKKFVANNPQSKFLMAKCCPHVGIQEEILLSLDESERAEIISDISYSKTRIMVAESMHNIDSLLIARTKLKGRDKSAEKIIKAKIDLFHAKQKLDVENATLVCSIREGMEALARYVSWSDEIRTKYFKLSKQWDALDFDLSEEEKVLYKEAFTKVSADVKHNMAINLSLENQKNIVKSLDQLCANIALYPLDKLLSESTVIKDSLSDLSWQLSKESETIPHSSNISERFNRARKAIESAMTMSQCVREFRDAGYEGGDKASQYAKKVLKATLRVTERSDWSNSYPELESVNEAVLEANSLLNTTKDARKEAKDSLDNLHKKINRLFGSAKRGNLARAQRNLASVTKAVSSYEGSERKKLDERIEELTADISKMDDWKDFAIEPKLIDLCEKMERLPELERQSKNPSANKLAAKIKTLQETWKAMGSSNVSDIYWPRFKEAGDKAYEPCAEFFKQRRAIQKENLQKREPLISKMKDLFESTDWEAKPDYKAVEDSLSQIMQNWKKIKDVEHGRGQKQWEKLAKIKDCINEKLDIEYDKNIAAKHALTSQFEQMLEQEVNEQTLDKLKFIQSKWKQVGVTRRKQDQTAWIKFKAASDAVYNKIQDLRQAKRSIEDEQIGAYKLIHKQIYTLAKSTQDLALSDKEFEALEEQYQALPALPKDLPEKLLERLDKEYMQACDAYAGAKDRLNKAKLDNELEILTNKAKLCSELEQLPQLTEQAEIKALQDKINTLKMSNKDYVKRFAKRLEKARETDREAYGNTRRLLLIEYEILLDRESPKEDKDMRLQIQLDRMKQQGIGNVSVSTSATMNEFKLEWLCMPGAEAELQNKFDIRFNELLK